jgi:hypothetical protein
MSNVEGSAEDESSSTVESAEMNVLDDVLQAQVADGDKAGLQRGSRRLCKPKSRMNGCRMRYSGRSDVTRARLEGSRRSARECRLRRKMRYQYVADMVTSRERAIQSLRRELDMYKMYCAELDAGRIPKALVGLLDSKATMSD